MGWMGRKTRTAIQNYAFPASESHSKDQKHEHLPNTSHVESVTDEKRYQPLPVDLPNQQLPFIEPDVVTSCRSRGSLWLVIDDIVYDCTQFATDHPGGSDVLESFNGSNCSWQFWRFHGKKEMSESGRPLRIGTTKGVKNKFKEPPRFVGLRTNNAAGW